VELPKTDTTSAAVRYRRLKMAREYWKFGFDAPEITIDPPLTYKLGKRTDNRPRMQSHANLSVAMLTQSAFLCGLALVLSVETTAEVVRADMF
jgi:hypothetical protein